MLRVALLQNWDAKKRAALFEEAIKHEPYYYATYYSMAPFFFARWGGDDNAFDRFVETSVITTSVADGKSMYGRLYWLLAESEPTKDPFLDLGIPWSKMKAGFDDIMVRYPHSQWNVHHYAYFACRVRDRKTFLQLLPLLEWTPEVLRYGAWRGSFTFEYCKSQFTLRT